MALASLQTYSPQLFRGKHYHEQALPQATTTTDKRFLRQAPPQANPTMTPQAHTSLQRCSTLVELLRQRAAQDPDRTALTFLADADTVKATLTYAELDRQARAIAVMLQSR